MDENIAQRRRSFLAEMAPYFERNESQTVMSLAQDRLEKSPDDLNARIAICRVWLQQGRLDAVREMLKETEGTLTGLADLYMSLGDVYLQRGLEAEAERFYQKFAALNPAPDQEVEQTDRGKPAGNDVDQDEEGSNASVPSDFETVTLAELYMRQGHQRMAEEILEKIARRDPQNSKARGLLNEIHGRRGQGEDAGINVGIIAELARWLENIGNLRRHAT
jgi:tetratricopeptide (TPR) repeat protein